MFGFKQFATNTMTNSRLNKSDGASGARRVYAKLPVAIKTVVSVFDNAW